MVNENIIPAFKRHEEWLEEWSDSHRENSRFLSSFNLDNLGSSLKNINLTDYNVSYSYPLSFESQFNPLATVEMMEKYEWVPYPMCALYIVLIFGIKWYMKDREPYKLQAALILWNVSLAIFSIWGTLRTLPELMYVLFNYGFSASVCFTRGFNFYENRVWGLWVWLFAVSKLVELGDTLFIVFRKRKLIFLHWYHHVATLFYTWTFYPTYLSTARWCIAMNYCVHSFMYSYFALSALKFKIPRWVSMAMTISQLTQMIMGIMVNMWAYYVIKAGNECHVSTNIIKTSLLIYVSYAVLFFNFFIKVYFKGSKKSSSFNISDKKSKELKTE